MAMRDLQRYPWNFILIKNVEDIVVFQTQEVFISLSFSITSYKQDMRESLMQRNHVQMN